MGAPFDTDVQIHVHFVSARRPALFPVSLSGKRAQGGIPSGSRGQRLKVLLMSPGLPRSLPHSLPRRPSGGNAGERARLGTRGNPALGSKETTPQMKSCCSRRAAPQQQIRAGPRPQDGSAGLNWGMTILRSDTTSFGLPVARIPRLQAGKTPPRDPKIHSRLGPDPEGGGCKPGQARPPMTVGLTTPQEC